MIAEIIVMSIHLNKVQQQFMNKYVKEGTASGSPVCE